MAGASLLTLLDDIASVLDDVSVLTKVAAKKTAGVLGDDLALNAEQVTGVQVDRELPVVWGVAKGSAINKVILVPAALAISALLPWLITPLLMLGGAYLCFEGVEKLLHKWLHPGEKDAEQAEHKEALERSDVDLAAFEKEKIKGAIRTDFVLSAEIIVIALGTVEAEPFRNQALVLVGISLLMTVGVYGLVALIVKLDDIGLYLARTAEGPGIRRSVGRGLVGVMPYLMKFLSVAGTAAMFLVGGGILMHGIPPAHHFVEDLAASMGAVLGVVVPMLINAVAGILGGLLVVGIVEGAKRLRPAKSA